MSSEFWRYLIYIFTIFIIMMSIIIYKVYQIGKIVYNVTA